jgi:hypothetical protein
MEIDVAFKINRTRQIDAGVEKNFAAARRVRGVDRLLNGESILLETIALRTERAHVEDCGMERTYREKYANNNTPFIHLLLPSVT